MNAANGGYGDWAQACLVESVQTMPFIGNSAIQNTFLISPFRLVLERSGQGHTVRNSTYMSIPEGVFAGLGPPTLLSRMTTGDA